MSKTVRMAAPVRLWAVVHVGKRASWINYMTLRCTRREARLAYLEQFRPGEYRANAAARFTRKEIRLAKVTVIERVEA